MPDFYFDSGLIGHLCKENSEDTLPNLEILLQEYKLDLRSPEAICIGDLELLVELGGAGKVLRPVLKGRQDDFKRRIREEYLDLPATSNDLFDLATERNDLLKSFWVEVYQACNDLLTAQRLRELVSEQQRFWRNSLASDYFNCHIINPFQDRVACQADRVTEELQVLLAWHLFLGLMYAAIEESALRAHAEQMRAGDLFQSLTNLIHSDYARGFTTLSFSRLLDLSYKFMAHYSSAQQNKEQQVWVQQFRSKTGLQKRRDLVDCAYLDRLLVGQTLTDDNQVYQTPCIVLTLDDPTQIECRLNTYSYLLEKLQVQVKGWKINRMCDSYALALRVGDGRDPHRWVCAGEVKHQSKEVLFQGESSEKLLPPK